MGAPSRLVARRRHGHRGDNLNDLEMLQYAGLPVVMGNCVAELKSLGWRETLSNDQGGVAAAIAMYAFGNA